MWAMRTLTSLLIALLLVGCSSVIPVPSSVHPIDFIDTAKVKIVDKDGKAKSIAQLKDERDEAVRNRDAYDAQVKVLDKTIEAEKLVQQRRWLIAVTVISFLGALVCLGVMLAWPNPLLVTLERIGTCVFAAIGSGAWFASKLLPYLDFIFGGVCLLIVFFVVRYIVTGRKLGASTQVAADLVDKVESLVKPAIDTLGPDGDHLRTRLNDFKSDAKSSQLAGGFWHMTEALRVKYDKIHKDTSPTDTKA